MARLFHGSPAFAQALNFPSEAVHALAPEVDPPAECPKPIRFGYLFRKLQVEGQCRLEESKDTVQKLICLGLSMRDREPTRPRFDSKIPSFYTYFGQFIVHDLTLDPITKAFPLTEDLEPLPYHVVETLENRRTGLMDLDSIYGPALVDSQCFAIPRTENGELELAYAFPYGAYGTDLRRSDDPPYDARIGDRRNDENLITSQLHLAFLRAHNIVFRAKKSHDDAQAILRQIYQHLVVKDFLPKIVAEDDLKIVEKENIFASLEGEFFMPIEFSAAAFRFGHSMIRSEYLFNPSRKVVKLHEIFMPRALGNYINILDDWIIDWKNFFSSGTNVARSFHPKLVEPLSELIDTQQNSNFSLAVRDLLRGYLLGLPTGQTVARTMGITPLEPHEIEAAAIDEIQKQILRITGFSNATPLWFYLFAESVHHYEGAFLGPVCGQIVASVLKELAQRSKFDDSAPWDGVLGEKEGFDLRRLIVNSLP